MLRNTEQANQFVFSCPVEVAGELQGLVTTPTGFDPAKERLPVILFLHGAGERGKDLELVKVHGIPKLFGADPDYHALRVITLSPQCPDGMVWNHLIYPLRTWLLAAVKALGADETRIAVTGLSMGGYGTWDLLETFPTLCCCGAPICGGGMEWRAESLRTLPIRVFHGLDDTAVPFAKSLSMVDAIRQCGGDVELSAYDKVGHGSWARAYEQTDLVEWLAAGGKR